MLFPILAIPQSDPKFWIILKIYMVVSVTSGVLNVLLSQKL